MPGHNDSSAALTTLRAADGSWEAVDDRGYIVEAGFRSQSDAYRWIDRQTGEPISPAEKRSDFVASSIKTEL